MRTMFSILVFLLLMRRNLLISYLIGALSFPAHSDISESPMMIYGEDIPILDVPYGYIKNPKKTIKNKQAQTREQKTEQKPEAKPGKVKPSVKVVKRSRCLPCGHIFGLSCINKWIQLRRMQAKCPQCNVKIGPSGVTKLYASPVVLVEEEDQQKKNEVSNDKDLKKENSNLLLIQEMLLKELRLLKKQVSTGTVNLEATLRNTDESLTAELVNGELKRVSIIKYFNL
ncbi:E3 ubiquitin protein ligase RFWD3 [Tanacetum coccineum]